MSDAKSNLSSAERAQKFTEQLQLYDQIMDCVLWLPESDFTIACSCDQCRLKIARLMKFEKDLQAKKSLIENYLCQTNDKEETCMNISTCVNWTKRLFNMFQKNLKAVCKELEVPLKLDKCSRLETLDKYVTQKLIDCQIIGPRVEKDQDPDTVDSEDSTPSDSYIVLETLGHGYNHYERTIAKDKAFDIIKKIENLENAHDMAKKIAQAEKMSLDPAVSKNYLEEQIEYVEKLPIDELLHEFDELIGRFHTRDYHNAVYDKAREFISKTCFDMIEKGKKFWQGAPSLSTECSDHNSNGLNETLDSLIYEVNSFEDQWRDDYAKFFNSSDRSNPKRQATS
ncbi:hypothetical protein CASFOL_003345 [Castilleja foliolosa]|uniref:Uncharacterized protein n=1 Tax=Castilleja foliolosa TaxID=1961234 RepID=A0ABD3EK98_9LAMI